MKLTTYWVALILTIALLVSGSSAVLAASPQGQTKIAPTEAVPPYPFNIIDTAARRLVDGSVAVFRLNGVETIIPLNTHKPYNTANGSLSVGMGGGVYEVSVRTLSG